MKLFLKISWRYDWTLQVHTRHILLVIVFVFRNIFLGILFEEVQVYHILSNKGEETHFEKWFDLNLDNYKIDFRFVLW